MSFLKVQNLVVSRKKEKSSKDTNIVLKGINATFHSGELSVIMGPNGSGKTTFLNILFGHADSNTKISGRITVDNKNRDPETWFKEASYVEQDSFQMVDQTIEDMIKFAIDIKSRDFIKEKYEKSSEDLNITDESSRKIKEVKYDEKMSNVQSLEIDTVESIESRKTRENSNEDNQEIKEEFTVVPDVQKSYKGKFSQIRLNEIYEALHLFPILKKNINSVSGGERKRVMIAIELVLQKKILILDEPTSDLDSHLALKLISYLKKIAVQNDILVVITIHQPSDQIFKKFDKILFLIEGKPVYFGVCSEFVHYLASKNIDKPHDWTSSDFIFEAFYNKSEFKEFNDLSQNVSAFLAEITAKSNVIVSASNPVNNGAKKFINLDLNISQSFIIIKRTFLLLLKTKVFYFNISCIIAAISLVLFLFFKVFYNSPLSIFGESILRYFPISFDPNTTVKDLIFDEKINSITVNGNLNTEMAYKKIYRDYVECKVSLDFLLSFLSTANFVVGYSSGIYNMHSQFLNEVSKGLYSSFTLFVACLALETLLFVFFGVSLSLVSIYSNLHKVFSVYDWISILIYFPVMSLTSHFINTLFLHPLSSTYIIKSLLYFLKTLGSSTSLYMLFYELIRYRAVQLSYILKLAFDVVIVCFFPTHFLTYLIGTFKIQSVRNYLQKYSEFVKDLDVPDIFANEKFSLHHNFIKIFSDNIDDTRIILVAFLISFLLAFTLAIITFSNVFNPRIACS